MRAMPWILAAGAFLIVAAAAAAAFAPFVYAELWPYIDHHMIVDPAPAKIAKGRMVDDYFAVQELGEGAYAIGEPRYYQENYAYLILGETRAILFDSGSGTRDMSPIVASLTKLPVTVIVSHLHFDHLGGIAPFKTVAMIDLPQTRADVTDDWFQPGRYEFLGQSDSLAAPRFKISEWLAAGAEIDLGGRKLKLLSTPGHTPTSVSLYDAAAKRIYCGDYMYPTMLYAFLPGASLSAYRQTAKDLLSTLPSDTIFWGAHCCRVDEGISAPWLDMNDLRDLAAALDRLSGGKVETTGFYPRLYKINRQMSLAVGFPWNGR
jgi:glyoxylase-like metal-dependent hydrolase (beta-lactamase superfamily II)